MQCATDLIPDAKHWTKRTSSKAIGMRGKDAAYCIIGAIDKCTDEQAMRTACRKAVLNSIARRTGTKPGSCEGYNDAASTGFDDVHGAFEGAIIWLDI